MRVQISNLHLIGTSHIAAQSVKDVQEVILTLAPRIVALELDPRRFAALMSPKRKIRLGDIKDLGVRGFLLNLVGAMVERKLGRLVNTPPGSEIKKAVECARKVNADIVLIDQDITVTLNRLIKTLTWKEKSRFIKDILLAVFHRRSKVSFDLRKVPDEQVIRKLTREVKKNYPSVYKTLIEERNLHMAKALNNLRAKCPQENIVVVIGAGHVEGLARLLKQ